MSKIHEQFVARSTGWLETGLDDLRRHDRASCADLRLGETGFWVCCKNGTHFIKMPRPDAIGAVTELPKIMTEAVQINVFRPTAHWYKWTVTDTNQNGIVAPTTGDTAIAEIQNALLLATKNAIPVVAVA